MRKYKFLIAFILCWISSIVTLFFLNFIWPTGSDMSVKGLILKTFGMSVVIVTVLFAAQNKTNK